VDTLADLPVHVRECLFWELDPVARARAEREGRAAEEKRAWVSHVLLEWGSCGRVLYVDGQPAGFVLYAPPAYFAGSASLPTSPLPEDVVQLATLCVLPGHTGGGLGRVLLQAMAKDLLKRGAPRAVEAIAATRRHPGGCVLPAEFLSRVGFRTHRPHPLYPRMRLELRSVLTWREDVEAALERLVGVVVPRPAPAAPEPPLREPLRGGARSTSALAP
ncbi:MAG: GNAT family N-acetyltransferase, partial [Actinomycetes bacterium]